MKYESQRGTILFVSLIMLLLITIVGLAAMRGTNLEERMASNLRDQSISHLAAEAALRAGEADARSIFLSTGAIAPNFNSRTNVAVVNFGYSGSDVARKPQYSLVYLRSVRLSLGTMGEEVRASSLGSMIRIDATGYGVTKNLLGTPAAQSELRSTYYLN